MLEELKFEAVERIIVVYLCFAGFVVADRSCASLVARIGLSLADCMLV
jgi:hypothetical protein